jgi:hypothetical protein
MKIVHCPYKPEQIRVVSPYKIIARGDYCLLMESLFFHLLPLLVDEVTILPPSTRTPFNKCKQGLVVNLQR